MVQGMKLGLRGIASTIILALLLGLCAPLSVGLVYSLLVERSRLESELAAFQRNTVNLLAVSVENALLAFDPNEAQNAAEIIFHDPRVLRIDVYSTVYEMHLVHLDKGPASGADESLTLRKEIVSGGEDMGYVEVAVDKALFFAGLDTERANILVLFAAMLLSALALIVPAIYVKALRPIARLKRQAETLSTGHLETAFVWRGDDELSVLGRTFEDMRVKLLASFTRIRELAVTDELTGLPNRRAFLADAGRTFEMSRRYGWPLTVIFMDLDHFKRVNDTMGHAVGDGVLQEFASLVAALVRKADIFARIGGEEFALCMPQTGLSEARGVAEKIRSRLEAHDFPHGLNMTASFGLAQLRDESGLEQLLAQADLALYRAKSDGRNCVSTSS